MTVGWLADVLGLTIDAADELLNAREVNVLPWPRSESADVPTVVTEASRSGPRPTQVVVSLDVSPAVAATLAALWGDTLPRVTLETLVAESNRAEKVGDGWLRRALGWCVDEADGYLKDRNIGMLTVEEFEREVADLKQILAEQRARPNRVECRRVERRSGHTMTLTLDVTAAIADHLQRVWGGGLARATLEGLVAESNRAEKLTTGQVGRALGMSLDSANGFLKVRDIFPAFTVEEMERQDEAIRAALARRAVSGVVRQTSIVRGEP